ncbi:Gfo/Idh/MocA family protein [Microlunatus parietis]|uniref:Putative dehydrogenase n=1 Tax=Microlunatus parietis TaxID=682979 RepID=A0A7Y9I3B0_9ACTN|nr:Gfo/Idh/MocA family oxidoreductase [Microlunatus parietis]NYE69154.1 putative dehydrogenase [Microlunatus parietis]
MPVNSKRIGVIGCGAVAQYGHLPAILRTHDLELAAVCEVDRDRLAEVSDATGARPCTSLGELVDADLDALVITSPAPLHEEHLAWAAEHRLPVLCEKPLTLDEAGSVRTIELMEQAGQPLYVGFTYRFAPAALEIRRLLGEGAVGKPRALRLIYLWDLHGAFADREHFTGINERREGRIAEGGPMIDCGVHQIDLARWWLGGEPVPTSVIGIRVEGRETPDHLVAHLDVDGCQVMIEISIAYGHTAPATRPTFSYEVIGSEGVLRYRREEREFVAIGRDGIRDLHWSPEKSFDGMYAAFADALATGASDLLPTGWDGLAATRIATDLSLRAAASG